MKSEAILNSRHHHFELADCGQTIQCVPRRGSWSRLLSLVFYLSCFFFFPRGGNWKGVIPIGRYYRDDSIFFTWNHCLWAKTTVEIEFRKWDFIPYDPSRHFPRRTYASTFNPLECDSKTYFSPLAPRGTFHVYFFSFYYFDFKKWSTPLNWENKGNRIFWGNGVYFYWNFVELGIFLNWEKDSFSLKDFVKWL